MNTNAYEVIIIGGSYAGLSAAMALGRSLRKTLILDARQPCNRFTPHAHNFLTHDGAAPNSISTEARKQALAYPTITYFEGLARTVQMKDKKFAVETATVETFISDKLVLATGVKDIFPKVPGFAECWGKTVVHCPYCHGYEIRNRKTAIIANGDRAFHLASLVNNLTNNISVLTQSHSEFDAQQRSKLQQHNIEIIETEISEIKHTEGTLEKINFADGSSEKFEAAYASIPFQLNTNIAQSLGCDIDEHGRIKVNPMFQTSLAGVYACGDNCSPLRSIATAVYGGNIVGAVLNNELTMQNF